MAADAAARGRRERALRLAQHEQAQHRVPPERHRRRVARKARPRLRRGARCARAHRGRGCARAAGVGRGARRAHAGLGRPHLVRRERPLCPPARQRSGVPRTLGCGTRERPARRPAAPAARRADRHRGRAHRLLGCRGRAPRREGRQPPLRGEPARGRLRHGGDGSRHRARQAPPRPPGREPLLRHAPHRHLRDGRRLDRHLQPHVAAVGHALRDARPPRVGTRPALRQRPAAHGTRRRDRRLAGRRLPHADLGALVPGARRAEVPGRLRADDGRAAAAGGAPRTRSLRAGADRRAHGGRPGRAAAARQRRPAARRPCAIARRTHRALPRRPTRADRNAAPRPEAPPAARRHPHRRPHDGLGRPARLAHRGRPRRRSDQGRKHRLPRLVARRQFHRGVLPRAPVREELELQPDEPQQARHHARLDAASGQVAASAARGGRRRGDRELLGRGAAQARARLRGAEAGQRAPGDGLDARLRFAQRLERHPRLRRHAGTGERPAALHRPPRRPARDDLVCLRRPDRRLQRRRGAAARAVCAAAQRPGPAPQPLAGGGHAAQHRALPAGAVGHRPHGTACGQPPPGARPARGVPLHRRRRLAAGERDERCAVAGPVPRHRARRPRGRCPPRSRGWSP